MPSRRWSRLALALLLMWQLNAAVAVAVPPIASVAQTAGAPADHCAKQHHAGVDPASQSSTSPAPAAPDCCHDHAASCHCAQSPALSMSTLDVGEAPPPAPPAMAQAAPDAASRVADFFRPPI